MGSSTIDTLVRGAKLAAAVLAPSLSQGCDSPTTPNEYFRKENIAISVGTERTIEIGCVDYLFSLRGTRLLDGWRSIADFTINSTQMSFTEGERFYFTDSLSAYRPGESFWGGIEIKSVKGAGTSTTADDSVNIGVFRKDYTCRQ